MSGAKLEPEGDLERFRYTLAIINHILSENNLGESFG